MMYCVYKHTAPNGKIYIGITCQQPQKRWGADGRGYKDNEYFFRAIRKHGWQNFKHEILLNGLTKAEACAKEIELIALHKSNCEENGYNLSSGGEASGAGVHNPRSEEAKRKQSIAMTGRKHTAETIAKIVAKNTGKKRSAEQRKRMSTKGHYQPPHTDDWRRQMAERFSGDRNPNFGKPLSAEQKQKISASTTNKREVLQFAIGGAFIKKYPSIKQAERETGILNTNIVACCKHKKPTMGGFVWRYADEAI